MALKFIWANGNPWQQNLPDCTIRSLALASNWAYTEICKALKVPCKEGYGYTGKEGAASVEKIVKTFDKKIFDIVEIDTIFKKNWSSIARQDDEYDDPFIDPTAGETISSLAAALRLQGERGRFIFIIRPNEADRRSGAHEGWHTTYVDLGANAIIDTFLPGLKEKVYGFMRIKQEAIKAKDDPRSLTYEIKLVDRGELWGDEHPFIFDKNTWKKKVLPLIRQKVTAGEKIPSLYNRMAEIRKQRGMHTTDV